MRWKYQLWIQSMLWWIIQNPYICQLMTTKPKSAQLLSNLEQQLKVHENIDCFFFFADSISSYNAWKPYICWKLTHDLARDIRLLSEPNRQIVWLWVTIHVDSRGRLTLTAIIMYIFESAISLDISRVFSRWCLQSTRSTSF